MSTGRRIQTTAYLAAIVGAVAAVGVSAPTATAIPGDPMDGCETGIFQNYCDGPIRPDGSWRRCLMTRAYYGGSGPYIPPVENCFIVPGADQIPPMPLGQPDHHIES